MKQFFDVRDERNIYEDCDALIRATAYNAEVRVMAIDITRAIREQAGALNLDLLSASLAAEAMMGAAFLGADLKNSDARLSVSILGDSPSKKLTVFCDAKLNLKVAINKRAFNSELATNNYKSELVDKGNINLASALGKGRIQVIKNLRDGLPYTGLVDTLNGDIAQSFVYYLALSEQRHAVMMFGLNYEDGKIKRSRGLFAELLPFAEEATISRLEKRVNSFPTLSDLNEDFKTAELMDLLMGDSEIKYISMEKVQFHCSCSKDDFGKKLLTLHKDDLSDLAEDEQGIEVCCDFCGEKYTYSQSELNNMIKKLG